MAADEHLLKSSNVRDLLDDIASADPPVYLRRCFAEGFSAPSLSFARVQQLAVCALELIADWRIHHAGACVKLKDPAAQVLRRALERGRPQDPEAAVELEQLAGSLGGA